MAGTYTKKEFTAGVEEQTLLKDSNAPRIVAKGTKKCLSYYTFIAGISCGSEPVRLSPGWEGTGRPEDELNFKGVTMDQADLELNPPKDRLNLVFLIMLLHGIGALMPWNVFITAKEYFTEFKFSSDYTGLVNSTYDRDYMPTVSFAAQMPNVIFNWVNIFIPLGGDLTTRIVWGIFMQVVILISTIVMAMIDTSGWPGTFFWITMILVFILNGSNGIYQNSVYGMAAKLPGKYTGAVILGSNISGTFTAVISLIAKLMSPNKRTAAIYYFITALFVLLACFDTYFALPINRYYRYHELLNEKDKKKRALESRTDVPLKTPYWKIFKQCSPQLFNVFFIFFVTLSVFPTIHSDIKQSDPEFYVPTEIYMNVMCFLVFNVTAMLGSSLASLVQWPNKEWLVIPVVLRILYIPLFLLCKFEPEKIIRTLPILIDNDWAYFVIAVTMGLSSGYLSSLAMMYCPTMVESQHASTAGMFAAAFLITGIFSGVIFAKQVPNMIVSLPVWQDY